MLRKLTVDERRENRAYLGHVCVVVRGNESGEETASSNELPHRTHDRVGRLELDAQTTSGFRSDENTEEARQARDDSEY